jgi:hypothetical protein
MAHTILSIYYSPIKSTQHDTNDDHSILPSLQAACDGIISHYRSCQIAISEFPLPGTNTNIQLQDSTTTAAATTTATATTPQKSYSITLSGPHDSVMAVRTNILRQYLDETQLELKIPMKDLPATFIDPACHTTIFETIRKDTQARISLVLPTSATANQQQVSSFESQNVVTLCISGLPQHTELARVRLLVSLDELVGILYYYLLSLLSF